MDSARSDAADGRPDRPPGPARRARPSDGLARDSGRRRGRDSGRSGDRDADPGGHPEDDAGDPATAARSICLRLLTATPKTRSQLAEALSTRGIPDDVAESVLDRFTEVGLIDDAAFAASWVSSRQSGRGLARRALAQELSRKGIDRDTAATALDTLDPAQEEASARELVRRKLRAMSGLDNTTATRRLAGMLARKGYPSGVVFRVIREELQSAHDGE